MSKKLDDYELQIVQWHDEYDGDKPLHEFLGLSWDEYKLLVEEVTVKGGVNMVEEIVEHPKLNEITIPEGWERLTSGDAMDGDMILVNPSFEFMPWVKNDGVDVVNKRGGSAWMDGHEGLVAYKPVVIRKTMTSEELFVVTINNKLPDYIKVTQSTEGVCAKDTSLFDISLSTDGFLRNDVFKPAKALVTLIEGTCLEIFNIEPGFNITQTVFWIQKAD